MSKKILRNEAFQSLFASLICIVLGVLIGYIVLLFINPSGAGEAIMEVLKNFLHYSKANLQLKNFGNTLVKTAPLLMCALSVLFAYKVGLFNIGAAGQYCVGICASIYCAIGLGLGWLPCMIIAAICGALYGAIVGLLKSYCNVNEVISGIMLNWIALYTTNMILSTVKESTSPYTFHLNTHGVDAMLPGLGMDKIFAGNTYVTIALPLAVLTAVLIYVLLEKTKFGFELKATGFNKNAAKYCGMAEKRNIIVTLMISGGIAALGASFMYLTDYEQWMCTSSAVPGMGFNGIAAAFLGGLNPIGTIFSSYFIQHITNGGAYVDKTMYCSQISDLISSLIIYLCGFVFFIKFAMNKYLDKQEEKEALKAKGAESEKGGDK
ncbi:MAG: ABC transporter permease [Oscillospiraceae bacterium]|nr:ABC transporter permease [Oscillospiraceae bacterium]